MRACRSRLRFSDRAGRWVAEAHTYALFGELGRGARGLDYARNVEVSARLFEGKDYFTIYDFVKAHHHFQDPEWDGPPQEPEGEVAEPVVAARKKGGTAPPGMTATAIRALLRCAPTAYHQI